MAKRKPSYKHPGGVLCFPRIVIRSPAYRDLSLKARCLMVELQDVWNPSVPAIHYSSRRAAEALGVTPNTAAKAFHELVDHGFIVRTNEADWFNGQAREYRLTWLPCGRREPTNEWMNWTHEKQSPVSTSDTVSPGSVSHIDTVNKNLTNRATENQSVRHILSH